VSKEEPSCTILVAAHGAGAPVLWRNVAVREDEAPAGAAAASGSAGEGGSDESDGAPRTRSFRPAARPTPPASPQRRRSSRTKRLGVPGKLRIRDASQDAALRCGIVAELAASPHGLRSFVQVPIGDPAAPHGALMLAARHEGAFEDAT
jgi:hypothetical protein